jgi:hypothetical protein
MRAWVLPLLLLANTALALPSDIHRCSGANGTLVFTDQTCESLGIADKLPPAQASGYTQHNLGFGCAARSPEAMRAAIGSAIEQRDINALSGLYNFNGRSSRSAVPVIRRLERLTHRAAVEIELVYPQSESLFGLGLPDTSALPSLRIVQHAVGNDGPLRIENFELTHAAGCVWLR